MFTISERAAGWQAGLFEPAPALRQPESAVRPAALDPELAGLAARLSDRFGTRLYLGTSSWNFPGWRGLVWDAVYDESSLSQGGLHAYSQHPLLSTVSLDRAFYRPLDSAQYSRLASQVGPQFRFVVKMAAIISDAQIRDAGSGQPLQENPSFLDPQAAFELCARPAGAGLGPRLGVLVCQLSPLPPRWLGDPGALLERLESMWNAVLPALPDGACAALELRDRSLLTPHLAGSLKALGVRYCVGLHDRMPALAEQLPFLRAMWPGDLVCRWNLQRGLKYAAAKESWQPFDRLQAPDPATRAALAKAIVGTLAAGYRAFVTINNKAEGSAPLSVIELAREIVRQSESA